MSQLPESRPAAERLWEEETARRGEFPPLEPVDDAEMKMLVKLRRVTPDALGRRDGGTWDGQPIWFRQTNSGIRWVVLTWHQDERLRGA